MSKERYNPEKNKLDHHETESEEEEGEKEGCRHKQIARLERQLARIQKMESTEATLKRAKGANYEEN